MKHEETGAGVGGPHGYFDPGFLPPEKCQRVIPRFLNALVRDDRRVPCRSEECLCFSSAGLNKYQNTGMEADLTEIPVQINKHIFFLCRALAIGTLEGRRAKESRIYPCVWLRDVDFCGLRGPDSPEFISHRRRGNMDLVVQHLGVGWGEPRAQRPWCSKGWLCL